MHSWFDLLYNGSQNSDLLLNKSLLQLNYFLNNKMLNTYYFQSLPLETYSHTADKLTYSIPFIWVKQTGLMLIIGLIIIGCIIKENIKFKKLNGYYGNQSGIILRQT